MIKTKNEYRLEKFQEFISELITDCDDERINLKDLNKEDRDKIQDLLVDIKLIAEDIDKTVEGIMKIKKNKGVEL